MIQSARRAGFFHQTMTAGGVTGHFIAEDLQGDFAAKARIPRAIHLAHAASVKRSDDFIAANPLTRFIWHGVQRFNVAILRQSSAQV